MEEKVMQVMLAAEFRLPQLKGALARLVREGNAQDLAEYGISMAVIGVGAAAAALSIRSDVAELWIQAARLIRKITLATAGS
jgi:hypothetical protein